MSTLVQCHYSPLKSFARRLVGCSGDCGSKFGILVNCVAYGRDMYALSINAINVIENAFKYHEYPIRTELINQMRQKHLYGENNIYHKMYYRLNNENYIIKGEKRVYDILSLLRMLASDHIDILTKIVNIDCKIPTRSLQNEIDAYYQRQIEKEGIDCKELEMRQNNLTEYIDKRIKTIMKTEKYHIMKEKGLGLTKEEISSIILHCDYDTFINKLRESHREQHLNSCEWRTFFQHLYSGINKIHKVFHYKNYEFYIKYIETRKWFNNKLFRGLHNVTLRSNNHSTIPLHTVSSFTDDFGVAKGFSLDKGMILCINDAFRSIYRGILKAANISWISRYSHENEWVVLPTNLDTVYKINPNNNPEYKHYIHNDDTLEIYETNVLQKHMIMYVNLSDPDIIHKAFLLRIQKIIYYMAYYKAYDIQMRLFGCNGKKQIIHHQSMQTTDLSQKKIISAAAVAGGTLGFCMSSTPVVTATVAGSEALGSVAVWTGIMAAPAAPIVWPWIAGGLIIGGITGVVGYAGSKLWTGSSNNDNNTCSMEEDKLKRTDNSEHTRRVFLKNC